jgi:hypothetical protein
MVLILALIVTCVLRGTAYSAIVNTQVDAGMQILKGVPSTIDASSSDSGTQSASVNFTGPDTNATVYSTLHLYPSSDAATLTFLLGWNANSSMTVSGMGASSFDSNKAVIMYGAPSSTPLYIAWDFSYTGTNPFGLGKISIQDNYNPILQLGGVGSSPVSYNGTTTWTIGPGTDTLYVRFYPSISGGNLSSYQGELSGSISLGFGAPQPVPIPGAVWLLVSGLLGLVGLRRRLRK